MIIISFEVLPTSFHLYYVLKALILAFVIFILCYSYFMATLYQYLMFYSIKQFLRPSIFYLKIVIQDRVDRYFVTLQQVIHV